MCLFSRLIENPKYKANRKNGWNPPPVPDIRVKYVPIGCQECIECRKQKAREWRVRMLEDVKHNTNGKFITLTFSNEAIKWLNEKVPKTRQDKRGEETTIEGYERDNMIAIQGVRYFLERWRRKHKKSVRHWLVTELGHNGTENIHIHGIIWTNQSVDEIERIWNSGEVKYGFVWKGKKQNGRIINYVNERTVNYIVKYVHKLDFKHTKFKATILTSPGIGNGYTKDVKGDWRHNKYNGKDTIETYRTPMGYKIAMPIYWRNKIYSEHEREQLWLHKLDKQERWVCGVKTSIATSEEEYYQLLKEYRRINYQLGYGNGHKGWTREQYEKERRNLLLGARIQAARAKELNTTRVNIEQVTLTTNAIKDYVQRRYATGIGHATTAAKTG